MPCRRQRHSVAGLNVRVAAVFARQYSTADFARTAALPLGQERFVRLERRIVDRRLLLGLDVAAGHERKHVAQPQVRVTRRGSVGVLRLLEGPDAGQPAGRGSFIRLDATGTDSYVWARGLCFFCGDLVAGRCWLWGVHHDDRTKSVVDALLAHRAE